MKNRSLRYLLILLLIPPLYAISRYNYLLFHILVESASILIGMMIYTISEISGKFVKKIFFVSLGPGVLVASLIAFLHTFTYKGMNIIPGYDANLPTQLWIILSYFLAFSFLTAILNLNHRMDTRLVYWMNVAVGTLMSLSCFIRVFPDCFVDGTGLTPFKKFNEYVIMAIYVVCLLILYKNRGLLKNKHFGEIRLAMILFLISGFMFSLYSDVYGIQNFIGHVVRLVGFSILYDSIVVECMHEPYSTIFSELYDKSNVDGLTDLYNYRYLIDHLNKTFETGIEYKHLYLMSFDVDYFNVVNDTYGHMAGDEVLKEMAMRMKGCIRSRDFAARQGGDEFSVVFYDAPSGSGISIANRIKNVLTDLEVTDNKIKITISAGVAAYRGDTPEELLKRADKLMYMAKKNGRNRICFDEDTSENEKPAHFTINT
jgi:diguanylate cyclase (GGDEF)-like protein